MQKNGDSLAFLIGYAVPHFEETSRPKDSKPSIISTMHLHSNSVKQISDHNQDVEASEGVLPHLRLLTEDLEPADLTGNLKNSN